MEDQGFEDQGFEDQGFEDQIVKSRLEKFIQGQLKSAAPVFETQLHRRTSFSALHNAGAGLRQLDSKEFNGIEKAIANAQAFAAEVIDMLEEQGTSSDAA